MTNLPDFLKQQVQRRYTKYRVTSNTVSNAVRKPQGLRC
jgi:hypothetical protein